VKYPAEYPEVAPDLAILAIEDEEEHPWFDAKEDASYLLNSLTQTIEDNIGIAMVYSIILALQDSVMLLMNQRAQVKRNEFEAIRNKAEEEENRKFAGSAVTRGKLSQGDVIGLPVLLERINRARVKASCSRVPLIRVSHLYPF
jgi:hypothetical protein